MGRQKMFKISQEERQKLLSYLQNRPYGESLYFNCINRRFKTC